MKLYVERILKDIHEILIPTSHLFSTDTSEQMNTPCHIVISNTTLRNMSLETLAGMIWLRHKMAISYVT